MSYSDSEGLPIAFLFHKKIVQRSLRGFPPSSFSKEQGSEITSDFEKRGMKPSEDEIKKEITAKWRRMTHEEKKGYPRDEMDESGNTSDMLTYREELLIWLVNLMRSPLPKDVKAWYV